MISDPFRISCVPYGQRSRIAGPPRRTKRGKPNGIPLTALCLEVATTGGPIFDVFGFLQGN